MRPLAVMGNVNIDLILGPAAPWPTPGTEIVVDHDELRVGGAAGNAALAWAGLGVGYRIAANVGDDAFGAWLRAAFGAQAAGWTVERASTTVSVGITHPGGERTFFTSRGHLPLFGWDGAQGQLGGLGGGTLLVCGSYLTDRLTAAYPALFAWARAEGVEIALDTGWPVQGWTPATLAQTRAWLPQCRHLLLNEIEIAALTGQPDPEAATASLANLMAPGGVVVAKLGPGGAGARAAGGPWVHVPAPEVEVIDTIGAGDVFNAGYLAALAQGATLTEALRAGTSAASTAIGTRPRRYGAAA